MRRLGRIRLLRFVVLSAAVLAAGCQRDVSITSHVSLSGQQSARSFRVAPGVIVTATADLRIDASRDVVIEGDIEAAEGSAADITIETSGGDVRIAGDVTAGDGRAALLRQGVGEVIVREVAENGGDIVISAAIGDIVVEGTVDAGAGGRGGDAQALGSAQTARAESGVGGNGGIARLEAGGDITIADSGSVRGGSGGAGGEATAGGAPAVQGDGEEGADEGGDRDDAGAPTDGAEADEDGDDADDAPLDLDDLFPAAPAPPVANAVAVARAGGRGGEVRLRTLDTAGRILIDGDVGAGDGGATSMAMAEGREAEATTLDAAQGGDVVLDADGMRITTRSDLTAAEGGYNGTPAGPDQASSIGEVKAFAKVGAGGPPGSILVAGSVTEVGDGGVNGDSHTQTRMPNAISASGGSLTSGPDPARAHQSQLPP